MKRRAKGTGGVVPYLRNGKQVGWRAEVNRVLPDKTHYYKSKTFPTRKGRTKADAERWLRDELSKLDAGTPDASGTLGPWLDEWLKGHKAAAAPSNWRRGAEVIERHIRPRLGTARLDALTAARVNAWLGDLHEAGVSASERKRAASVLKKVLRAHERVPRSLWDRVKLPSVRRAETRHLTAAELADLIAAADSWGGWYGAMARVAVDCGLRAGEILGLKWGDYDPVTGRLHVRRSVCVHTLELRDTKTDRSDRTLPLSAPTRAALDALPRGPAAAALFAPPRPGPSGHYGYDNWRGAVWAPLVKAAGLSGTGVVPKSLRHTCASQLIAAGVNILVVSRRLGHADPAMTLRVYAHMLPDDQDRAAAALGAILTGAGVATPGTPAK